VSICNTKNSFLKLKIVPAHWYMKMTLLRDQWSLTGKFYSYSFQWKLKSWAFHRSRVRTKDYTMKRWLTTKMDWSTTTNYDAGVQASMPIIYLLEFCHNSVCHMIIRTMAMREISKFWNENTSRRWGIADGFTEKWDLIFVRLHNDQDSLKMGRDISSSLLCKQCKESKAHSMKRE